VLLSAARSGVAPPLDRDDNQQCGVARGMLAVDAQGAQIGCAMLSPPSAATCCEVPA